MSSKLQLDVSRCNQWWRHLVSAFFNIAKMLCVYTEGLTTTHHCAVTIDNRILVSRHWFRACCIDKNGQVHGEEIWQTLRKMLLLGGGIRHITATLQFMRDCVEVNKFLLAYIILF